MDFLLAPHAATFHDNSSVTDSARALKLLSQCSRALARIHEEQGLLSEVCRVAVEVGGYQMAWVGLAAQASGKRIAPAAFAGHEAGFLARFASAWGDYSEGVRGPLAEALQSGAAQQWLDLNAAAVQEKDPALHAHLEAALQQGYRCLLALPLRQGNGVLGVLMLYSAAPATATPHAEIALWQDIADNLACSLAARGAIYTQSRRQADQEIRRLKASLEERVQQRTAQLQQANQALESFCHSVSHDLRTPLSAVDGFAHLLEQALDNSPAPLADKKRHYLRRIRAGMLQMGELIEALLRLARLARAPMTVMPVDLSRIASEVVIALREREPSRLTHIDIEPDLTTLGDASLLRQLMENLLGNAWKFSGGKALTHIRFARSAAHDKAAGDWPKEPVFVVEDQGAGFNMAYAQNLFGPFQRLHSPSEFEGTGIGLATVQRIVHRHGGRIWAEAEPGQGARFYFSLGSQSGEDLPGASI